jgi:hypothetical protein
MAKFLLQEHGVSTGVNMKYGKKKTTTRPRNGMFPGKFWTQNEGWIT